MNVILPIYCNLQAFEETLAEYYIQTKKAERVIFDFSGLEWIGVLQSSILFGWIEELLRKDKIVTLTVTSHYVESQGLSFLNKIRFFQGLEKKGALVKGSIDPPIGLGVAAFEAFTSPKELAAYESALLSTISVYNLLGGGSDIDLISEGDLRDILLRELGENAFIHGSGRSVRYAVCEFQEDIKRRDHLFLAKFDGSSYIETVISDGGPGIIRKLKDSVPPDYIPDVNIVTGKLTLDVKTILYAFEFSSTCNESGRKDRIAKILTDSEEIYDVIPSGLFYVACLAKLYGGQIIVRSGKCIVSIDYSKKALTPFISANSSNTLIEGTHFLIRVPRNKSFINPVKIIRPTDERTSNEATFVSLNEQLIKADYNMSQFLVNVSKLVDKELVHTARAKKSCVVLLCTDVHIDTKVISLLLVTLAIINRRNRGLLLLGVKDEYINTANEQWKRIIDIKNNDTKRIGRIHGFRSFLLYSNESGNLIEFGDTTYSDSTVITHERASDNNFQYNKAILRRIYEIGIKTELIKHINMQPVCHEGYYYLIEGKYYTKKFYEIGRLLSNNYTSTLAVQHLESIINNNEVSTIYVISNPLKSFSAIIKNRNYAINIQLRNPDNERSSFLEAWSQRKEDSKLMILTDVICTASEITKFVSMASDINHVVVFTFVDGREEDVNYIVHKTEKQAYSIPLYNLFKDKITPITDLPHKVNFSKVMIIDPITHSPTIYNKLKPFDIKPEDVLRRAIDKRALIVGHLVFDGKHYTDFLYFKRLFFGIINDIQDWFGNILQQLQKKKIKNTDIVAFYLQENRGWESLLHEYMATKGIPCVPVSKAELISLHIEKREDKKFVWFVLPVIATGETASRCLEYASLFSPIGIHISVIVARMHPNRLLFYQNITGYNNINTSLDVLSYFPIISYYNAMLCPTCTFNRHIETIHDRVVDFKSFNEIFDQNKYAYIPCEISIENIENNTIKAASNEYNLLGLIRMYYEEATRNYVYRKNLAVILDSPEGILAFLEYVGNEPWATKFKREYVQRNTYNRYPKIFAFVNNMFINPANKLNIKQLLGIHILFPSVMAENVKPLLKKAIKDEDFEICEQIIYLALLYPESYGVSIVSVFTDIVDLPLKLVDIKKDVLTYSWYVADTAKAVEDYLDLLWLLRRSTEWGTGIERLRTAIDSSSNHHDIINHLQDFMGGALGVINRCNRLKYMDEKSSGGLWSAIVKEAHEINETVTKIEILCITLKNILESTQPQIRSQNLSYINDIDVFGKLLTKQLERIFTNPIDVKFAIEKETRWQNTELNINFIIAADQPGILISTSDLLNSLIAVIDNANDCINEYIYQNKKSDKHDDKHDFWLEINFDGYTTDKKAAVMKIRDNLPWTSKVDPSGGMKQFIKYCKRYAAMYDFYPEESRADEYLKLNVLYKIDEKREKHEYPKNV